MVDEISTKEEAAIVAHAAQRGVAMVSTLHGYNLQAVFENETNRALFGNIDLNTQRRHTSPVFSAAVVIVKRGEYLYYDNVKEAVDELLARPRAAKPHHSGGQMSFDADAFSKRLDAPLSTAERKPKRNRFKRFVECHLAGLRARRYSGMVLRRHAAQCVSVGSRPQRPGGSRTRGHADGQPGDKPRGQHYRTRNCGAACSKATMI